MGYRSLFVASALLLVLVLPARAQLAGEREGPPWLERSADGFDRALPKMSLAYKGRQHFRSSSSDSVNVDVTNFTTADQTEPAIAIDPTDPNTIIIGANDDRDLKSLWVYTSHDGGRTWLNQRLPDQTLLEIATDPSVAFDRSGAAYFLCGRMDGIGIPFPRNDVVCYRSSDHGDTWTITASVFADSTTFGGADTLADKYYLAIDNAELSPHRGRLYAAWVDQGKDDTLTRIVVSHSDDSGYHWSHRKFVTPDESFYHAPVPAIGRDGKLLIAYLDLLRKEVRLARSADGGESFVGTKLSDYRDLGPVQPPGNNRGYPIIKHNLMVNSFPSIATDIRPASSGRMYVTWTALDPMSGWPHVYMMIGVGDRWTTPHAIESDRSSVRTDKFFPWVAVDPVTGHVGVTFYDSRLDTTNTLCDLFLATSADSGETFHDERVSTRSMDPTIGRASRSVQGWDFKFFGDYIGLAAHDGVWRPAWCDSRGGDDLEIYSTAIREAGRGVQPSAISDELTARLIAGGDALLLEGRAAGPVILTVTDVLGREHLRRTSWLNGTLVLRLHDLRGQIGPFFYQLQVGTETIRTGRLR